MARILPKRELEAIRDQNDIAQVIGSYFQLQRAGSSFKALCPFHKEKTPSFHVNPQRQSFHCFGCGAGGDVFRFIMQHEGVDFMTAVKMLAQRAGISIHLEEDDGDGGGVDKALLYEIHGEVSALYRRTLLEHPGAASARAYLEKRELPRDIVEAFQIGFAPDRWDTVLEWARHKKLRLEDVETAGLILRKQESSGPNPDFYDRFRNRLMFPIHDEQSRVIGFSGRAMQEGAKTAKYVNSPETPLFKKSRILYALDKARRAIVETREALVCEGQIDVIRCHQAGVTHTVAAQGTAFTEEHVRILKRYADSVCIMFDADHAGQDAAIRTAALFMEAGMAVRVAMLSPGDDPDSFIRKHGAEAFRKLMSAATSAVQFQIQVLGARADLRTEVGVMRAAKAVLETIAHSPNAVQRAKLVQEAASRLNLPATALMDDLRHLLRQTRAHSRAAEEPAPAAAPARAREEVELCEHLAHVVDHPGIGTLIREYLPLNMIQDRGCRLVAEAALRAAETGDNLLGALQDQDDPSGELMRFAASVLAAPAKTPGNEFSREDAVKSFILRLWRRKFENDRAALQQAPATPENEARSRQITSHLHHLKRWEDGAAIIKVECDD